LGGASGEAGKAEKLMGQINSEMADVLTHNSIDTASIDEAYQPDSDEKTKELANRPMSVKLWSRNPDMDLYQGNYSPCCVSIEGSMHGKSSPIADYNTDLGIQVVNIYDEAKKIPVVAAWSWVGKDHDGRPALVVDNIEANTDYSSHAPDILSDQLFAYLQKYAEASNLDRIVLGTVNNDLPKQSRSKEFPKVKSKYKKLGGTNDENYYLEAEDETVVSLWEKGGQ
jgi:hypothetical protein